MPPSSTQLQQRPLLTVSSLHEKRFEKARVNRETYRGILHGVYNRIQRRGTPWGSFGVLVPAFVLGRPFYELSHACRYVTQKLRAGGFEVAEVDGSPGRLTVSWAPPPLPRRKAVSPPPPQKMQLREPRPPKPPKPSAVQPILSHLTKLKSKYGIS